MIYGQESESKEIIHQTNNHLSTTKSIAEAIINLDGDECYVTENEPWQIYEAFWKCLFKSGQNLLFSIKQLINILKTMKNILAIE